MKRIALACLFFAAACSKGDDCQKLADRTMALMKDIKMPEGAKDKFLEQCRKDPKKYTEDPDAKCIIAAKDDSAAADCMKKGMEDYMKKSKKSEPELQLNKIGKSAKVYFVEQAKFPVGTSKLLPADNGMVGCCGGKDNKCAVSAEWANDPVWKALDFQIDEATLYRYSYTSADGKSFKALAVGDTDCDNDAATFTLTGTIDAAGNPSVNLEKPAEGKY